MNAAERPFDQRIRDIRGEVQKAEEGLCRAGEYLADLPGQEREKALKAMQDVFDAGVMLGEHQHTSPMNIPEQPLIGPDLRAHLREAQVVQTEMGQLRNIAQQIFHQRSARMKRSHVHESLAA